MARQVLRKRMSPMRLLPEQVRFWNARERTIIVAAGRRSAKTEIGKRKLVHAAITTPLDGGAFFACAPTHQQAKNIFWNDLRKMVPTWALRHGDPKRAISKSELRIDLRDGNFIRVSGVDVPERIEGGFGDGFLITEFDNCPDDLIDEHVRPMMVRGGWMILEGTPEGRKKLFGYAQSIEHGELEDASFHTWFSETALPLYLGREAAAAEIRNAKSTMDTLVYRQEYLGRFVEFAGRLYYAFDEDVNVADPRRGEEVPYDPNLPLRIGFDFNRSPGVLAIAQEIPAPAWLRARASVPSDGNVTAFIDEVWIERNSNTPMVCDRFLEKYANHPGDVRVYGDATGRAKKTSSTEGSDWDLVRAKLRPVFGRRLRWLVEDANPSVRARVNAVNSRCRSMTGAVGLVVSGRHAKRTAYDLANVEADEAGEVVKVDGDPLTHISDGAGYMIEVDHPVSSGPSVHRAA
ncbi:MAG: hypothetical protein ACF8XB_07730 [Planctomycetota bacterium JB042]